MTSRAKAIWASSVSRGGRGKVPVLVVSAEGTGLGKTSSFGAGLDAGAIDTLVVAAGGVTTITFVAGAGLG